MDLLLTAALLLLVVFLLYKLGTRTHGTLERLGVPVVPPLPFLGSTPQPWATRAYDEDMRNARRYGRVWGAYEGPTPQLFINDVELAKRIFIKDFDYFSDRPNLMDFEYGRDMMDVLPADQWKPVRSVFSGLLASGAKLKGLLPVLKQCTEDACQRLDKKLETGRSVSLQKDLCGPIVLDAMSQFSFGMKFNVADPNNKFVKEISSFSSTPEMFESKIAGLMTFFPMLYNYVLGRMFIPTLKSCISMVSTSMKQRRIDGIERPDVINVLIDTVDNKVPTKEFQQLKIDENLLLVQGAELLVASYDTTGLTTTMAAYYLVKHPDVLARLVDEVETVTGEEITYESLQEMPLLDAVLHESQRLTPLVSRHMRLCVKDWQADGLRIPAGMYVMIPVAPYHMDERVFPDPERFDPDRWLGDKGLSIGKDNYMPFGVGPRNCIGQRLALMECKFILAYILKHYRISANANTKLRFANGMVPMNVPYNIEIDMEKIE